MSLAALWSAPAVSLGQRDWYPAIPSNLTLARAVPPPGFTRGTTSRFSAGNLQAAQHRFDTLYFAEDAEERDILGCASERKEVDLKEIPGPSSIVAPRQEYL